MDLSTEFDHQMGEVDHMPPTNEKKSTNELRKLLEDFPANLGLKFGDLLILYKISVGGCFPEPGGQSHTLCIR